MGSAGYFTANGLPFTLREWFRTSKVSLLVSFIFKYLPRIQDQVGIQEALDPPLETEVISPRTIMATAKAERLTLNRANSPK
jgi:hypothetical protein